MELDAAAGPSAAAAPAKDTAQKMDVDRPKQGGGKGFELPWVEKYRPTNIRDVVGNEEAVARLRAIAEEGNIPNIILAGPPGTGKTTSILAIAHQLLGPNYKEAVLELNASDDRGIDVVRNKIKMFAQKKVTLPPGRHKIVILDEADSMTPGAQQALRRTMELYSNTTRFALACNTSSKVIEPIQSRCSIARFTRVSDAQVLARIKQVIEREGATATPEGLEAIVFTADGDMRQALNNLQATHTGFGDVTPDNVFKVCDQPHPTLIREVLQACIAGRLEQAYTGMKALCDQGYSAMDVITTLFRVCRNAPSVPPFSEFMQLEFLREIGFTHVRIGDGVNSRLQLSGLLARLCRVASSGAQPQQQQQQQQQGGQQQQRPQAVAG
ncbi:replication factor C subunit 2 [Raphidocelis subcapitata]|uniref:Replication factor C subunit 2 n=1 Tax=Raphidocelis subcapitata TaxID=307507 RepID=A0A2V0P8I3_9CHLO|nr:replication factor C subunit 2 [Raphidocelis subcapitata]|eukprot:GBF96156.1 replication factor C subunit 2 [Raphidocelis subcapitata]